MPATLAEAGAEPTMSSPAREPCGAVLLIGDIEVVEERVHLPAVGASRESPNPFAMRKPIAPHKVAPQRARA